MVKGRLVVVVVVVETVDVGVFTVVEVVDVSNDCSDVVEMTGIDVDFVVIFGM